MVVAALALVLVGVVIVALPDSGDRLFSLSEEHGPSALDAVGIVLLLAGWLLLAREVWRRRPELSRRAVLVGLAGSAAGAVVLAAGLAGSGPLWILGVALLAAPQAALVVAALRR